MKKFVFGLLACVTLLAVSCETSDIASDDAVYEEGVDKTKVRTTNRQAVDKTKVRTSNR